VTTGADRTLLTVAFSVASIQKAQKRKQSVAPSLPPLGSYDPSLLLQYGANNRAAQNAQGQYDLGQAQAQDNFGIQTGRVDQSLANNLTDLGTSKDRSLADLLTNRDRNQQDYTTASQGLDRRYAQLGRVQGEHARQQHIEGGGILAQSLAKRQANRALDQQPLDTSLQRSLADSTTAQSRLGQDYTTNTGRAGQAAATSKADLALALARGYGSGTGGNPLGTQTLNLTQTQNDALGGNLDLSGVAYGQAAANGFRFPSTPKRKKAPVIV
jgi:hypothetical protein